MPNKKSVSNKRVRHKVVDQSAQQIVELLSRRARGSWSYTITHSN